MQIITNNDSALLPTAELDCWSCLILICGERLVFRDTASNKYFPLNVRIFVLTTHTRTHACTNTHTHKHTHTHTHTCSLSLAHTHTNMHKHTHTHTHTFTHTHTHTHAHIHMDHARLAGSIHFSVCGVQRVYIRGVGVCGSSLHIINTVSGGGSALTEARADINSTNITVTGRGAHGTLNCSSACGT